MGMEAVIRTENLTKVYGNGENAVRALDGVNLSISRGEMLVIPGNSGCGKSTLLHMLGGIDRPTADVVYCTQG